jgi:hypothetical protein
MNIKYCGIIVALMLVVSATLLPAIHGSKINSLLETHLPKITENDDKNLIYYFKKMNERGVGTEIEILNEIQIYLSCEKSYLSTQLHQIYTTLQNKLGEQEFNDFMGFMLATLRYLNSNGLEINDINNLLYGTVGSIRTEILSTNNDISLDEKAIKSYVDLFKLTEDEQIPKTQLNSHFETYWIRYGKAKCYWYGYMPGPAGENEFGPIKIWNVNTNRIGLWSGTNFYDWHQNAVDYIIGLEEDTGKSTFVQLMNLGIALSLILFIASIVIWGFGFFSSNDNWILFGGGIALFGLMTAIITAYYLYVVLYYFLYGSNAYFEMQRYGNVDFIVHVINETGKDITSDISVKATSTDASLKYNNNEPVYPEFENVPWSIHEFEYDLAKVKDQYGNDKPSTFCLHSSQETPEKWKKAVPPPGTWSFIVNAAGYTQKIYNLEDEILPGECFTVTIPLQEL